MKIRIFLNCLAAIVLLASSTVIASEKAAISAGDFEEAFSKSISGSPVLLKYMALENNCKLVSKDGGENISVTDKNGVILKTYSGLTHISGTPIIDASVIEHDLGWTVCKHIPNTDMFHNEKDATIAGGLTYFNLTDDDEIFYYVGNCYEGYYFSPHEGEHAKNCVHSSNANMFYEKAVSFNKRITEQHDMILIDSEAQQTDEASAPAPVFHTGKPEPVLLKYILRKNDCHFSYSKEDDRITVYNTNGAILTNVKGVATLFGNFAMEVSAIERIFGFGSSSHSPDVDLFDSEADAATAGWLTYGALSEDTEYTFLVGNCYGGYYFSQSEGRHEAECDHRVNKSMFYEKELTIQNGILVYDDIIMDKNGYEFSAYIKSGNKVFEDKPAEAFTKMVTVTHTEYDKKEDVQNTYFSYRDRVYRSFWDDLANYDVTDYIFIPPNLPISEEYTEFNREASINMADAIRRLMEINSNAKLWIGTPGITGANFMHSTISEKVLIDFLNSVKGRIGSDVWEKSVVGVYINQESIYPDNSNAQVDRIKNTVDQFKRQNPLMKALWIPYYDLAEDSSEIAVRISEVSRIPNMFDYIIIQPGYFFFDSVDGALVPDTTMHRSRNIDAVKSSVKNNYVSNSYGMPVNGEFSDAIIGFEMEPQASYFSNSRETREESIDRYTKYLIAGAGIKDAGPIAFYTSGDPHCNKEVLVYKFYEADELSEKTVRKKLDHRLDEFYSYVFETRENDKVFQEYAKRIYMEADASNSEESFLKAFDAGIIIPEFYKYEQRNDISDLASYLKSGGELHDIFKGTILMLLGVNR